MSDVITVQDIVDRTGEPTHNVRYALKRYGPEPVLRMHNMVLYREEDFPLIEAALAQTAKRSTTQRRRLAHA